MLLVCVRTYLNCRYFFPGRLTINILDIILASYLSFMSIFFNRPNGELCVLSIVNFSIFVPIIILKRVED